MAMCERSKLSLWLVPAFVLGFMGVGALVAVTYPRDSHIINTFALALVTGPPLVCMPVAYVVGRYQFKHEMNRQRFLLWTLGLMLCNIGLCTLAVITAGFALPLVPIVSILLLRHVIHGLVLEAS